MASAWLHWSGCAAGVQPGSRTHLHIVGFGEQCVFMVQLEVCRERKVYTTGPAEVKSGVNESRGAWLLRCNNRAQHAAVGMVPAGSSVTTWVETRTCELELVARNHCSAAVGVQPVAKRLV